MTEWNKYWKREYKNILSSSSLEGIISNDLNYYLLRNALLNSGILKKKKGLKLLDAGSGSGLRSLALMKEFDDLDFDMTFCDLSEVSLSLVLSLIKVNQLENKARFSFILGDLLHLPFENEEFDIVWNCGVMEHFKGDERQRIFTEIYRVCGKGGVYVSIVPNYLNIYQVLKQKYQEKKGTWQYGYQRNFSIFELRKRMKACGFEILSEDGTGSFNKPILEVIDKIQRILRRTKASNKEDQTNLPPKKLGKSSLKGLQERIETKFGLGKLAGWHIAICGQK